MITIASVGVLVISSVSIKRIILVKKITPQRKKIAGLVDFLNYSSTKIFILENINSTLETHPEKVNRGKKLDREINAIKRDFEDYEIAGFINNLIDQKNNSIIRKEILELDKAFFTLSGKIIKLEREISLRKNKEK
jgi:hypothetical protein